MAQYEVVITETTRRVLTIETDGDAFVAKAIAIKRPDDERVTVDSGPVALRWECTVRDLSTGDELIGHIWTEDEQKGA